MAFRLVQQYSEAPIFRTFMVTNSEAITDGQALILSSGRLTKAAVAGNVGFIAQQDVKAGTDNTCRVIVVTPNQVWEADYIGTADSGFIVGCTSADIDTGVSGGVGLNLNAADVTGGAFAILSKDTTNLKCHVICKLRQMS